MSRDCLPLYLYLHLHKYNNASCAQELCDVPVWMRRHVGRGSVLLLYSVLPTSTLTYLIPLFFSFMPSSAASVQPPAGLIARRAGRIIEWESTRHILYNRTWWCSSVSSISLRTYVQHMHLVPSMYMQQDHTPPDLTTGMMADAMWCGRPLYPEHGRHPCSQRESA